MRFSERSGNAAICSQGDDRVQADGKGAEGPQPEDGVTSMTRASGGDPGEGRASARRVLVIEDNVDAANSLREALELEGHDIAVAYDGLAGLELARQFAPEVLLCDIGLPGMDGYGVARAFRADPALCGTRLIAVTGYALPEDKRRAAEAGFDAHLAKPPDLDVLLQVVGEPVDGDSAA